MIRFDIEGETAGDAHVATAVNVRLHVFHQLQTASPHATDLDVSAGARGLTGEAYRGHIFWDELSAQWRGRWTCSSDATRVSS